MAASTANGPLPQKPAQPPDERFWVKYSPHHELPISSLASVAWHTFGVVLIVLIAFVVSINRTTDMPIESVRIGGGPGNPDAVGPDTRSANAGGLVEAANPLERPKDFRAPDKPLQDIDLQVTPTDLLAGITDDPEAMREVAKLTERGTQALDSLSKLDKSLRDQLLSGKPGGPGPGGPGSGNPNAGGPGNGPRDGEGGGALSNRTKRNLRWTMMFNTTSGSDYVRQLHVLGAVLAFKNSDGETKVVKNLLARPVRLDVEDIRRLDRIFWIDDKRESVEQLARALGLDFMPDRIVAFFPKDLENLLLMKELSFRNKREEQILETRFQILMRGNGRYEIVVVDQRYY
jgi:hypothetical protein